MPVSLGAPGRTQAKGIPAKASKLPITYLTRTTVSPTIAACISTPLPKHHHHTFRLFTRHELHQQQPSEPTVTRITHDPGRLSHRYHIRPPRPLLTYTMAEPQPPNVVEGATTGDVEDEVQAKAKSAEDRKAAAAIIV